MGLQNVYDLVRVCPNCGRARRGKVVACLFCGRPSRPPDKREADAFVVLEGDSSRMYWFVQLPDVGGPPPEES